MFLKVAAEYESQHVITFAMMEAVRNEVFKVLIRLGPKSAAHGIPAGHGLP